jgi:CDP-diglyceride synthetase
MDAYHAPYVTKNRYWTGLLLLARVVLYLTAAINVSGEPRFNLLAISLIIGTIFLLHAYSGMSVYKQWVLNVLEFTTYFNILALAVSTFYVLQINGNGTTVALVSIGAQFVLSVCAMTYHIAIETNVLGRMKKSSWYTYQQRFRLELTTRLLQNETEPPASSQVPVVTFSEITISDSNDQLVPYTN